jgi:sec-independent protein translocase protein TatA
MFGFTEILVLLFVILLLFGAKKLPALGGALGESLKNFKKGMKDNSRDVDEIPPDDEKPKK